MVCTLVDINTYLDNKLISIHRKYVAYMHVDEVKCKHTSYFVVGLSDSGNNDSKIVTIHNYEQYHNRSVF